MRPFNIDCGQCSRMQCGYRKKTDILRLPVCPMSVPEKIEALSDLEDKRICQAVYDYLMSSLSSSYLKYHAMRAEIIYKHKEPSVFAMYTWEGIECALWPQLYPFTTWCESIHDGCTSRKSSKVSFITKCLCAIVDYCLDFDLLQCIFDRWLYKTITGAINTYRSISQSQSQSAAFFDVTKTRNKRNKPVTSGTSKEQVSNKRNNQGTSQ